jgi:hypothetical protein
LIVGYLIYLKLNSSWTFLHHQVIEFGKKKKCSISIELIDVLFPGWVFQKCLIWISKSFLLTAKISILTHYFKIFSRRKSEQNWRFELLLFYWNYICWSSIASCRSSSNGWSTFTILSRLGYWYYVRFYRYSFN